MPVNAFKDIRAAVRRQLQDLDGNYWTDDDLDAFVNEGQYDFCTQTKCLRAQAPITSLTNLETYDLPEDFLEAIRLETADGTELKQCDWEHIQSIAGNNWRATKGNPEYWFSDLDGHQKFRMYPRPDPTAEVNGVEFAQLCSFSNYPTTTVLFVSAFNKAYLFTTTTILVYEGVPGSSPLLKSIPLGAISGTPCSGCVCNPTLYTYLSGPTLFFATTTGKIYKVDLRTSVVSLFGSATTGTANIFLMASSGASNRYIYWTNGDSFRHSPSDTFAESSAITGASCSAWNYASAYATGSLYFVNTDYTLTIAADIESGSPTLSTHASGAVFGGICRTADRPSGTSGFFVSLASGAECFFAKYDTPDTPILVLPSLTERGPLFWSGNYVWLCSDYSNKIFSRYSVSTGEIDEYEVPNPFFYGLARNGSVAGEYFWTYPGLFTWDTSQVEQGCVANIDDTPFTSDEGVVVDIIDDEASIVFDSDYGAVVQIIEDEDAYNLWYIREPRTDVVELRDTRPLEAFALVKAYTQDKDTQSGGKADMFFKEYMKYVAQERTRLSGAYLRGSVKRPVLHTF